MNSYNLNTYSDTRHNSTIIVGILIGGGFLVLTSINKQPFILCMILFVTAVIVAKILAIKFYKATATFAISDLGFTVSWAKNFQIFPEPDYNFVFANLQYYVFEQWGEAYRLKVKTKEGKTIKFLFKHKKSDEISYEAFFTNLQNSINGYNNRDNHSSNDLRIGGTFWQSKTAQIAAFILAALLVCAWKRALSGNPNVKIDKLVIASVLAFILVLRIIFAAISIKRKT